MKKSLWRFIDNQGTFESENANQIKALYFPLANEQIMSSISPDLHGDIKANQDSFLLEPVSRINLTNLRSSRNFWIYINKDKIWSATGASKYLKEQKFDQFKLEAGFLWHKVTRANKKIGLKAEILSFIPCGTEPLEVMQVKITNISNKKIRFTPFAAVPIYGRSANNLRDHRHVTSLLQEVIKQKFGIVVRPRLVFHEGGHQPGKTHYFVLGFDGRLNPPAYLYPTQEGFCGMEGDLEAPVAVLKNILPDKKERIQGKEPMGGFRFQDILLRPKATKTYTILIGIAEDKTRIKKIISCFNNSKKVRQSFEKTRNFWISKAGEIRFSAGDRDFDNWLYWVNIQPTLRKIFGCSFLPDFDYGKGGRGWRDLWQDCLTLILISPKETTRLLMNNFSGVRIDGSNATIIGKGSGEFISDRNNVSRVWMDHGIWPLLTTELYIDQSGNRDILFKEVPYFRDDKLCRAQVRDWSWRPSDGHQLRTSTGKIYYGTIFEHLLIQNLVQFFNVGPHNYIRLEDADWNDGLDMAAQFGESVAFSCMYAENLNKLACFLRKMGSKKVKIIKELAVLLKKIDYSNIRAKQRQLLRYFALTKDKISGERVVLDNASLANDLEIKSQWLKEHIRKDAWLKEGFFNGYYDNKKRRVEGKRNNIVRLILSSQVFAIMSTVSLDWQIKEILESVKKYLFDRKLKSFHLNTDFKEEQHDFGRAFSFVYGDKENGAFFNHMTTMFAYALYKRSYVLEGWKALSSIYKMAIDSMRAKIFPCLPEYFNLEGRGMYCYLTGSASWFILTLLTQVFGIRGEHGNLVIEPKLCREQFKYKKDIGVCASFAERRLRITFSNHKGLQWGRYRIVKAVLNSQSLPIDAPRRIFIARSTILKLPKDRINEINLVLG